ncbi:stage II sporulation protein P [Tuberibacillus sp. Marseille-P3662]|uniref:stage II sporulation protein P n=1 Tax=Tuberibacillus sp. Marseille-P3662 TaxID=1965358 RepID=UPI001594DFF2|nr:stage II sporulation protein P [Tuberibacillus sp. Marseille-P3662]
MFQPITPQQNAPLRKISGLFIAFLVGIFIICGILSSQMLNNVLFVGKINQALTELKAEFIVDWMSAENPYLAEILPANYQENSFSQQALTAVTNINFQDERSFLGNELPGFSIFDTKILAAGQGTDYTNIPVESPPPMEYIKDQRNQAGNQEQNDEKQPPVQSEDVQGAKVFMYHTHSYEAYLPLLGLKGADSAAKASSNDASKSVLHVGKMLKDQLSQKGVKAVHDQTYVPRILKEHKNWDWYDSYQASRTVVKPAINSKTDYDLLIDIHRDSQRKKETTATINGEKYARVSFIYGEAHNGYQKNLSVMKKLNKQLNDQYPGLSLGVFGKGKTEGNGIYNQDLGSNVILIEIGGVDNTEAELNRTVEALSNVFSEYVKQAEHI